MFKVGFFEPEVSTTRDREYRLRWVVRVSNVRQTNVT